MPASASLVGDSIQILETTVFDDGSIISTRFLENRSVVVDDSVELPGAPDPGFMDVDVNGVSEQIILTFSDLGSVSYNTISILLDDLDWVGHPGFVTDVSVVSNSLGNSSGFGFDVSTSWTPNSIFIELEGLDPATGWGTMTTGEELVLSFSAGHTPVPEPATLSLLGMGLAGLIFRGRKQRA